MTIPSLPTQLLCEIFSNLASSPPDLYRVLLCSKSFCKIARPILYTHITIKNRYQRWNLRDARREDKALVKKVTIQGDGPIDIEDIESHFGQYGRPSDCNLWEDCIAELLTGKLLDISVIETLHVRNVHESPEADSPWEPKRFKFKVASNLKELSISGHQGGSLFWSTFLKKKNVPQLRRLEYAGVTQWTREVAEYDSQGLHQYYGPEEVDATLDKTFPYAQFDVLVADQLPNFGTKKPIYPLEKFLALVSIGTEGPQGYESYPNVKLVCPLCASDEISSNVLHIVDTILAGKTCVKFLELPLHLVTSSVSERFSSKIAQLRSKGVTVHLAQEEEEGKKENDYPPSSSIVSKAFLNYLETTEKQKGKK